MKKYTYIPIIIILAAGACLGGCRSRITASTEADEILDAQDALGQAESPDAVSQWNGSFTYSEEKPEETTPAVTEVQETTEPEEKETQESESEEPETKEPEAGEQETQSGEEETQPDGVPSDTVPQVTTVSNNTDEKPKNENAQPGYSDDKKPGADVQNNNDGPAQGSKNDKPGSGGEAGLSPGIGTDDPTIPPTTEPLEPETPSESQKEEEPSEPQTEPEPEPTEPAKDVFVRFDPGEGRLESYMAGIRVTVGGAYTGIPSASRGGYTFAGWFTEPDGNGVRISEGSIVGIEEDHTLYAFWAQREIHTVRFHADGTGGRHWFGIGGDLYERQVYVGETYGDAFPVPTFKSGYSMIGWFDDPEGGNPVYNTDIFTSNTDVDLYIHADYDPLTYWVGIMNNLNDYPCKDKIIISEYDQNNIPLTRSVFAARLGRGALQAMDGMPEGITTEELIERKPAASVFIKIIGDMSDAEAVANEIQTRFPQGPPYNDRRIYVIPAEAENGSPEVSLVYNLALKKMLWPDPFENTGLNPYGDDIISAAMSELGVGSIYIVER